MSRHGRAVTTRVGLGCTRRAGLLRAVGRLGWNLSSHRRGRGQGTWWQLIRLVSDRSIWDYLGHSPTKRDAEGNVTERDEITVLDIDTINWAVVEIGHIDRTEILKNQLVSLTDEFALLPGDMRTCEPQITL